MQSKIDVICGIKYQKVRFGITCSACKELKRGCPMKLNPAITRNKKMNRCEWFSLVPVAKIKKAKLEQEK